jgi:hypothetical protein
LPRKHIENAKKRTICVLAFFIEVAISQISPHQQNYCRKVKYYISIDKEIKQKNWSILNTLQFYYIVY